MGSYRAVGVLTTHPPMPQRKTSANSTAEITGAHRLLKPCLLTNAYGTVDLDRFGAQQMESSIALQAKKMSKQESW